MPRFFHLIYHHRVVILLYMFYFFSAISLLLPAYIIFGLLCFAYKKYLIVTFTFILAVWLIVCFAFLTFTLLLLVLFCPDDTVFLNGQDITLVDICLDFLEFVPFSVTLLIILFLSLPILLPILSFFP